MSSFQNRQFIIDLADIDAGMLAEVGGKALNLGLLIRHGLRVPPGFCLTTAAYEAACAEAADRGAVMAAELPPDVRQKLMEAYAKLGPEAAVAVRSSANTEDLPSASFAGQQETILNVRGGDALLEAVRRCWASLRSDRAAAYRRSLGLDPRSARMAVVIQVMVPARTAGVLFTANPVTGRRHEAVIDASFGLGESVVSGAVTPDHFVVDPASGTVLERRLGSKRLTILARAGGGTRSVDTGSDDPRPSLGDHELAALARVGQRIENAFGSPRDIEWAIDDAGEIWIVQARAVTTLFPLPRSALVPRGERRVERDVGDLRVFYSLNASQGMERPFTPLGMSMFRIVVSAAAEMLGFPPPDPRAGPPFLSDAGGRLFLDVTAALRSMPGRFFVLAMTAAAESRAAAVMKRLAGDPAFSVTSKPILRFAAKALGFLLRSGVLLHFAQSLASPKAARARILAIRSRLERLAEVPSGADQRALVRRAEGLLSARTLASIVTIMPGTVLPGMACLSAARRLLRRIAAPEDFAQVQRSFPNNVTSEMNAELWRIAALIPPATRRSLLETAPQRLAGRFRERSFPPAVQRALDSFMAAWGHRSAAELDAGLARWSEDPAPLFAALANCLQALESGASEKGAFEQGAEAAERRLAELVRRARGRSRFTAALVRFCLRRARDLLGFRETPRFYLSMLLALARGILRPVGTELARTRVINDESDIAFLSIEEIIAALDGKDIRVAVKAARETYENYSRRHAPAVLLSDGTEPGDDVPRAQTAGGTLRGVSASAGVAAGPARVVLDPAGARLEPGEILVAPSTDPGWTPLFLTAGALVMETGGPMAHGAIVAREYGIPAVVAVPGATTRIRSGMRVTVDGNQGIVSVVGE